MQLSSLGGLAGSYYVADLQGVDFCYYPLYVGVAYVRGSPTVQPKQLGRVAPVTLPNLLFHG